MSRISVEPVDPTGTVRVLRIERPEHHNCIDGPTAVALCEAIEAFAADSSARVLVITGRGDTAFCTGADLKNTASLGAHAAVERSSPLGFARLDPGKPVIAAINGYAFAGGFELAAWCDMRIASENAEFGVLNRRWGVPLIDGGTQRLPRIVGLGNALYLIETGMRIDAAHALRIGFVQEVVPVGTALDRSLEIAQRVAEYPQSSLRADRRAAIATYGFGLDEGMMMERAGGMATLTDPEMAQGLQKFLSDARPEPPRPAGA